MTKPLLSTSVAVRLNTADVASAVTKGDRSNSNELPVASLLVFLVSNILIGALVGTKPSPPPIT